MSGAREERQGRRDEARSGRRDGSLGSLVLVLLLGSMLGLPGCARGEGTAESPGEADAARSAQPARGAEPAPAAQPAQTARAAPTASAEGSEEPAQAPEPMVEPASDPILSEVLDEEDRPEARRIIELLALEGGEAVADVGSGDGEWTVALARAVGPEGIVWANGIHRDGLDEVEELVEEHGLEQVQTALGGQQSTGLPDDCCSAMLLRLVYHHFTHPAVMRRVLDRALRPGARLLVIDIRPQSDWRELEGVPDRGGHGITPEELISDLEGDGFEVVSRHEEWYGDEDRFAVLFRAPE